MSNVPESTPQNPAEPVRLQKYLARSGVDSRRNCEALITAGRVTVNGVVADELGVRVVPGVDKVELDGRPVVLPESVAAIMLHKPCGYVTTMSDPQGRPTVAELVPEDRFPGLFPVGRLDMDTSGLLLFSTDGELGNALLHPRKHVEKTYFALCEGVAKPAAIKRLEEGVMLDDGPTLPAKVRELKGEERDFALERMGTRTFVDEQGQLRLHPAERQAGRGKKRRSECCVLSVTIHEGRKREVRRMLREVGNPVVALHREVFGPLELGDLAQGSWRVVEPAQVEEIRRSCLG